jgi:hypothetical protein
LYRYTVVRNRTPLCFDLPKEIEARRLIFESGVGGGGGGGGGVEGGAGAGGAEAGGEEWVAPALSLSGRIQLYRWQ